MEASTRGIGRKENTMAKAITRLRLEPNTMETGREANTTELGLSSGQMGPFSKGSGRTVEKMEKANSLE
jgi:hypothetical protein